MTSYLGNIISKILLYLGNIVTKILLHFGNIITKIFLCDMINWKVKGLELSTDRGCGMEGLAGRSELCREI